MGNIDFSKSTQYTLSIRLSADGFSFTIHHPQSEDIHFMTYPTNPSYSMTANIKKMLAVMEELKYPYQSINILIDTPRFILVPFDIFEDEQTETFFHLHFSPKENETILCNILGKSNVAILSEWTNMLINFWPSKCPTHEFTLVSVHYWNISRLKIEKKALKTFMCIFIRTEWKSLHTTKGNCL